MATTLNRRLVALQGMGGTLRHLALQGLWTELEPPEEQREDWLRQPPKRKRKREKRLHEEEALLLTML